MCGGSQHAHIFFPTSLKQARSRRHGFIFQKHCFSKTFSIIKRAELTTAENVLPARVEMDGLSAAASIIAVVQIEQSVGSAL
jgi:hypothetical protein